MRRLREIFCFVAAGGGTKRVCKKRRKGEGRMGATKDEKKTNDEKEQRQLSFTLWTILSSSAMGERGRGRKGDLMALAEDAVRKQSCRAKRIHPKSKGCFLGLKDQALWRTTSWGKKATRERLRQREKSSLPFGKLESQKSGRRE